MPEVPVVNGGGALTVRISSIPQKIARDQFFEVLEAFIGDTTPQEASSGNNIILSSFAPAPTSTGSVATVTFRDIPPVLSPGGLINLGPFSVVVDVHFFGLTPLNNPTGDATVDIIAVTGLAGHAFGSWKGRSKPTMWLRDFLPEHIPTARILTYGYDSKLVGSESNPSIRDFAGNFLEILKTARAQEKEKCRPIVFIGHSLGGLVIKQALVKDAQGSKEDDGQHILLACYSILFFGVPNRGLNIVALRSMVKGQLNSRFIEDLDPESHSLPLLHDGFGYHFRFEDSPIISAYETMETKTVVESSRKGFWERTGPMVLMVPKASATYSGPTEKKYDQLSIEANHSDMVKFSSTDNQDFLIIQQRIVDLVKKAPEIISKRFTKHFSELQRNVPEQLCNRINVLLTPIDFEADVKLRLWDRCGGTGGWLLLDPKFVHWFKVLSSETLWLYGNPGCGKTYLISLVLEYVRENSGPNVGIAYFFCDNKTENLEKRRLPFIAKTLASQLLGQIASSFPRDVETCLRQFEMFGDKDEMVPMLFQDTLKRIGKHFSKVFLILDGLDECDDVHNLLRLLDGTNTIPSTFQILLASRDIGSIRSLILRMAKKVVQSIHISQEQIKQDVEKFVHSRMRQLDIRDLGSEDEAAKSLIDGCDSLFLLARFRIESLKQSGIHTHQDLKDALFALPDDLTKFYDKTLKALKENHERGTARKIFMWVIYSRRQLSFEELVEAVSRPGTKLTRRGLDELCGGLLVSKPLYNGNPSGDLIELAHSTVKEYIFYFVWGTTPLSPPLGDKNACHSEIVLVMLAYMDHLQNQQDNTYQLLSYVCENWIQHLFEIIQLTSQLVESVDRFLRSENCFRWWDSPITRALNSPNGAKEHLQSQFHGWIMTNTASDSKLREHVFFMITQQEKQVRYCKRENGRAHPSTLREMSNLATTYLSQGRWTDAEALLLAALTATTGHPGVYHPDTGGVIGNLAATYMSQQRWTDAEVLQLQVLAISKRFQGEDHFETLVAMGNLATTYANQGRWSDAEALQLQVLATRKRLLGEDHVDTMTIMGNIGVTYTDQGRWSDAEVLQLQVLATCRRLLGEDHVDTMNAMGNLAATYTSQKRWSDAEALQLQVLPGRKRLLGVDHPVTVSAMVNLGTTYTAQGRSGRAEALQLEVLATRKRLMGGDHLDTVSAMAVLATTYRNQGRLKNAEVLQLQVLAARTRLLGEDHGDTSLAMADLAMTYLSQGRWADSKVLLLQALPTRKRLLGEDHPEVVSTVSILALFD